MDSNLLYDAEAIFIELDKLNKFGAKYHQMPIFETHALASKLKELNKSLPLLNEINNIDDVIKKETKRRIINATRSFDSFFNPQSSDFQQIIQTYGIPQEDINALEPWLKTKKQQVQETISRLFQEKTIEEYELGLPLDLPHINMQAQGFATTHISKYHKHLGKMVQKQSEVGDFLRDIETVPTNIARSYFHPLTRQLAIGIPAICFMTKDGSLHLREKELIQIYGHEGMGHALNHVMTDRSDLPAIIKRDTPEIRSTMESIAQFYENVIFEDLKNSPETQKALGIDHKFDEIYQDHHDTLLLTIYNRNLNHYALATLADISEGVNEDSEVRKRKIVKINEVAIDPSYGHKFIEGNYRNVDSEGNVDSRMVGELIYVAQPVQRVLQTFADANHDYNGPNRELIDKTILTGLWTPEGLVEQAQVVVKNLKE